MEPWEKELLEMAESSEEETQAQPSSTRRSKAAPTGKSGRGKAVKSAAYIDDSDAELSGSEEEEVKYTLEGKYIDQDDKDHLYTLPEVEREQILADRLEKMQKVRERKLLARLHRARQDPQAGASSQDTPEPSSKRQRLAPGKTEQTRKGLDNLKAKRAAKASSSKQGGRDADDDSASATQKKDGHSGKSMTAADMVKGVSSAVTAKHILDAMISRHDIDLFCHRSQFKELIQDAYIWWRVPKSSKQLILRCAGLSTTMKYSVAREIGAGSLNKTKDRLKATDWKNNTFAIETADISNQRPNEYEIRTFIDILDKKGRLPSKDELVAKAKQIIDIKKAPMTNAEHSFVQSHKAEMGLGSVAHIMAVRTTLLTAKHFAEESNDTVQLNEIEKKLQLQGSAFSKAIPSATANDTTIMANSSRGQLIAAMNERRRKLRGHESRDRLRESERKASESTVQVSQEVIALLKAGVKTAEQMSQIQNALCNQIHAQLALLQGF